MCFPRKASLGHYDANRVEWETAYRAARIAEKSGIEPDPKSCGVVWKAGLIVAYERDSSGDYLTHSIESRLASKQVIDKIILKRD